MKVLHVIPTLAVNYGGPSQAAVGLARSLRDQGVHVTIATTVAAGPEVTGDFAGVTVVRAPRQGWPAAFAYSPALAGWLDRTVTEFDLVHVHTLFNHPSTCASAAARRHGVPFIVRPCGMLDPWSLRRSRLKKRIWLAVRERRNLQAAAALHFTSVEEQRGAEPLGLHAPGIVIPLGVDVPVIEPDRQPRKVVLFLSRLHPKKGLDLLIPALGELARRRDDFTFVLAGNGTAEYEHQVRALLAAQGLVQRTTWAGFVQGPAKTGALAQADIFVLPSYQENFGIAVAEAMAAGLPVVISDRVNIYREVLRHGAGLVTPPTVGGVAAALERLLDDDELRRRMGQNGRRLVREQYDWPAVARPLIEVYRKFAIGATARPAVAPYQQLQLEKVR